MSKQRMMLVALLVAVAAAGLFAQSATDHAGADATALDFSPAVISLEGIGDSTVVSLEVTGLVSDAPDTVQVNIQHGAQFSISAPACGTIYAGGSVSGAISITGGTAFTCARQNGPTAADGVVATFTITKNDDVTGETVLDLLATGPFRTTFFEAGTEVLPGTLGSLAVWDHFETIADQTVDEDVLLTPVVATSIATSPSSSLTATVDGGTVPFISFLDNGDLTGTFTIDPTFDDAGDYTIVVTSDNGVLSGTETFLLTVNDVNRPPVLTAIGNQTVAEGDSLPILLVATDPDADGMTFTATVDTVAVPTGFTALTPTGVGTATLAFSPGFFDFGTYSVVVTVIDDNGVGTMNDFEAFTLDVTNTNQDPTVAAIADQNVDEGALLPLDVAISGSDLDGQDITLTATIDGTPFDTGFSSISVTVSDAATLSFTPAIGDVGVYSIVVTATDTESGTGTTSFTLTVNDVASITAPVGTVTLQGVDLGGTHDAQFTAINPLVELIRVSDSGVEASMAVLVNGSFAFHDVPTTTNYRLRISAAGYLTHELGTAVPDEIDVSTTDFDLTGLPLMLRGGLVTPGDEVIDGADLSALLASLFDTTSGGLTGRLDGVGNVVDLDADGAVLGGDESTLISNFGLSGDQPWL